MSIKSSFVSTVEQIVQLNNNNVELLAGLNQIVSSKNEQIELTTTNSNGQTTQISLPTVGYLQAQINRIDNNIKTLSGVNANGSVIQPANNVYEKIIKSSLNREPNKIDSLENVNNFVSVNNSFFDALLNPLLAIEFDLTNKISTDIRQILSRRYIIEFETDSVGVLTTNGTTAQNLFNENFKNRVDISISEIETWLTNTPGIKPKKNGSKIRYDEQFFSLDPSNLQYDGLFTILGTHEDIPNQKLYYLFDTLDYFEVNSLQKLRLAVGDELMVNTDNPTTRFRIIEISTAASEFRVLLEKIEGYQPIPVSVQGGLKFYSNVEDQFNVRISIGFDEYNIIFVKPVNTSNHLLSRDWSTGTAFYSNDLSLISDENTSENGLSMTEYYINSVNDYGLLLKDLASTKIPLQFALTPNIPSLNVDNFTVVQINKHITDTANAESLKSLHAESNTLRSNLDELNTTITNKREELVKRNFKTNGDKTKVENEISKLVESSSQINNQLSSVVNQIISLENLTPSAEAEFRIRGFFPLPDPVSDGSTRLQEPVQFITQYRRLSTTGQENPTESFQFTDENGNQINASFSNWITIESDIREREFNITTQKWIWKDENLSDADVRNINQIDIPIEPNESIEIRVASVSEVGFPDVKITSDYSTTIIKTFPDDLKPTKNREDVIVRNAELDNVRLLVNQDIENRGFSSHFASQFTANNKFYAHDTNSIGFNENGVTVSLTNKLSQIVNNEDVESYSTLELESGWKNFGSDFSSARYYKHELRVYLTGVIRLEKRFDDVADDFDFSKRYPDLVVRSSNPTQNVNYTNIATLPEGYRPDSIKVFMIPTSQGVADLSDTGNFAYPWGETLPNNMDISFGRLDIYPNGLVRLVSGATGWISLDNLSFRAANTSTQQIAYTDEQLLQLSRLSNGQIEI